jgi:hypothetical protein
LRFSSAGTRTRSGSRRFCADFLASSLRPAGRAAAAMAIAERTGSERREATACPTGTSRKRPFLAAAPRQQTSVIGLTQVSIRAAESAHDVT